MQAEVLKSGSQIEGESILRIWAFEPSALIQFPNNEENMDEGY